MYELRLLDIHLGQYQLLDQFELLLYPVVEDRDDQFGKRLADLYVDFAAQGEDHRGTPLGEGHPLFEGCVHRRFIPLRHSLEVDRSGIAVEGIHIERRYGGGEDRHRPERLV